MILVILQQLHHHHHQHRIFISRLINYLSPRIFKAIFPAMQTMAAQQEEQETKQVYVPFLLIYPKIIQFISQFLVFKQQDPLDVVLLIIGEFVSIDKLTIPFPYTLSTTVRRLRKWVQ